MNGKYKINIIYGSLKLENIFEKTLLKELNMIYNNIDFDVTSLCAYLSLKEGGNN